MISKVLVSCLVLLSGYPAFAATKNVFVQCQLEGPVYSGTLDFETDMSKWEVSSPCRKLIGDYYRQQYFYPTFKLAFNGMAYVIDTNAKDPRQTFWADTKSCELSEVDENLWFRAIEPRANKMVVVEGKIVGGKVLDRFEIQDHSHEGGELCEVQVVP